MSINESSVDELNQQLLDRDLALEVDEDVKELLIRESYQPGYGARPLRRIIQKMIEDPLSEEIINGRFEGVKKVNLIWDGGKPVFVEGEFETVAQ